MTVLDDILDGDLLICCGEDAPTHAPWCTPSALVEARARFGLPTRPVGAANRARFVSISNGDATLAPLPGGAP